MSRPFGTFWLALLLAWASSMAVILFADGADLWLTVDRSVCSEPCAIKMSIGVVGYEPGRSVCFALREDGWDAPYRGSCWPWDGRKITDVRLGGVPAGDYEIMATLPDVGKRSNKWMLHVVGIRGEDF